MQPRTNSGASSWALLRALRSPQVRNKGGSLRHCGMARLPYARSGAGPHDWVGLIVRRPCVPAWARSCIMHAFTIPAQLRAATGRVDFPTGWNGVTAPPQ